MGHLCGILIGALYNHKLLDWLFLGDVSSCDLSPVLLGWLKAAPPPPEEMDIEAAVSTAAVPRDSAAPPIPPAVNADGDGTAREALRILVEMGFDRNRALGAIRASGNVLGAISMLSTPQ